jgi:hypothetical protein
VTTITYRQVASIIASLSGKDRTIPVPTTYIDLTGGDHVAALFLSQVLYWTQYTKNEDGWFYKTAEEWYKEVRLTYRQISRVSKALKSIGLETKLKKHNGAPTSFYRINFDIFIPIAVTFVNTGFSPFVKIAKGENHGMSDSIPTKGEKPDFNVLSESTIYSLEDTKEELTQETEPPNPVPLTSPTPESEFSGPREEREERGQQESVSVQKALAPTNQPTNTSQTKTTPFVANSSGFEPRVPAVENLSQQGNQAEQLPPYPAVDYNARWNQRQSKKAENLPPWRTGAKGELDEGFVEHTRHVLSASTHYVQKKEEAMTGDAKNHLVRLEKQALDELNNKWDSYQESQRRKSQPRVEVEFVEPAIKPIVATKSKRPKLTTSQSKEVMRLMREKLTMDEAYEKVLMQTEGMTDETDEF